MWSNSKLNSFTKSLTSGNSSSSKSTVTRGESLKKMDKSSFAKTISNNFSSLSNYSLSLAVGNNNKNPEKYQFKEQNESNNLTDENISNTPSYKDV